MFTSVQVKCTAASPVPCLSLLLRYSPASPGGISSGQGDVAEGDLSGCHMTWKG